MSIKVHEKSVLQRLILSERASADCSYIGRVILTSVGFGDTAVDGDHYAIQVHRIWLCGPTPPSIGSSSANCIANGMTRSHADTRIPQPCCLHATAACTGWAGHAQKGASARVCHQGAPVFQPQVGVLSDRMSKWHIGVHGAVRSWVARDKCRQTPGG